MYKYIILLFLLLSALDSAYSQKIIELYKPEIIKDGNGFSNYDQSYGIFEDSQGNLYHTGYFEGEITFGNSKLVSRGGRDIFVAKINKDGGWYWAVSAGGVSTDFGKDIACDNAGNIFVTGYYYSTCYFGNLSVNASANSEVFIAKLSNTGNWLWARTSGGNGFNRGNGIICDNNGNVYVTGSFEGNCAFGNTNLSSNGLRDVFVTSLNPNGNWRWTIKAGGNSTDDSYGIKFNSNYSFLGITGFFSTSATFGSNTLISAGGRDIFVARLDTNANWQWSVSVGSSASEESRAISIDGSGNSIISGFYSNSITFASNTLPTSADRDVFAARIDRNGNWIWGRNATGTGDDEPFALSMDNSGNAYITGFYYSNIKFGSNEVISDNERNSFVARLTSSGSWSWVRSIKGNSSVDGLGIWTSTSGYSYISGTFYDKAYINTDTIKTKGESDLLLAKISSSGGWDWIQGNAGVTNIVVSNGIIQDKNTDVFVCGYFNGTVKFGNDTLKSVGLNDIFIAKSSKAGSWISAISLGGIGNDAANSLTIDTNGNIYVTGYFEDIVQFGNKKDTSAGFNDIFISKFDSGLNLQWARRIGDTESDEGKKIFFKSDNIFVTGNFSKGPFFGSTKLNSRGFEDIFVSKLDLDGNFIWALSAGSNQFESSNSIYVDNNGDVLVTGSFEGSVLFGSIGFSTNGNDDIFLAKTSSQGSWLWAKKFGTTNILEAGYGVTADEDRNIYLSGTFRGLMQMGSQYLLSNGNTDIFVSKHDTLGNVLWAQSFGSTANDYAYDLFYKNDFLKFSGAAASQFSIGNNLINAGSSNRNAYLLQMQKNGSIDWVLSESSDGISEIKSISPDLDNNTLITGRFTSKFISGNKSILESSIVDLNAFSGIAGFALEKPTWTFRDSTGKSSLISIAKAINPKVNGRNLINGDAIGIFYLRNSNYYCAGMTYWNGSDTQITVWGDDTNTPIKDGFSDNEKYNIIVWDALKAEEVITKVRYQQGPDKFSNEAFSIISQIPIIYDSLRINLKQGWNIISSYNLPVFPRMDSVFQNIKNQIIIAKAGDGKTYIPQYNINNIGDWNIKQGYQVYCNTASELIIEGDFVTPEITSMNLNSGWNIISYLRKTPMSIVTALAPLVSQNKVVLVKNADGKTYIPQYNINNIGNLVPGQGYQIYLNSSATLTYPAND